MTETPDPQPTPAQPDHDAAIDRAADWLRARRVVAFPTETVYGLGASALDERSIALVFQLKNRPPNNPLIVHVSSIDMARGLCREWPESAETLAQRFWPGPLTLILPAAPVIPANVNAGTGTVAIRMPDHPVALALIERFGGPIVGPSANPSGGISPTTANHVAQSFAHDERVMILDGGACTTGIESTVLDLTQSPPRILRPGSITADELAVILDAEVVPHHRQPSDDPTESTDDATESQPILSPGMLPRHYAPHTTAHLLEHSAPPEQWTHAAAGAERIAVLGSSHAIETARVALADRLIHAEPMPESPAEYARRLYAALRNADATEADIILIEHPGSPNTPQWQAIHDRLTRATTTDPQA